MGWALRNSYRHLAISLDSCGLAVVPIVIGASETLRFLSEYPLRARWTARHRTPSTRPSAVASSAVCVAIVAVRRHARAAIFWRVIASRAHGSRSTKETFPSSFFLTTDPTSRANGPSVVDDAGIG